MLKVIGVQHKSGDWEMEGKKGQYDNMMFYCSDNAEVEGLQGLRVSTIKIKTSLVDEMPSIGDDIQVYYDEYRKPVNVSVVG